MKNEACCFVMSFRLGRWLLTSRCCCCRVGYGPSRPCTKDSEGTIPKGSWGCTLAEHSSGLQQHDNESVLCAALAIGRVLPHEHDTALAHRCTEAGVHHQLLDTWLADPSLPEDMKRLGTCTTTLVMGQPMQEACTLVMGGPTGQGKISKAPWETWL